MHNFKNIIPSSLRNAVAARTWFDERGRQIVCRLTSSCVAEIKYRQETLLPFYQTKRAENFTLLTLSAVRSGNVVLSYALLGARLRAIFNLDIG
jgi:hypothetical protein